MRKQQKSNDRRLEPSTALTTNFVNGFTNRTQYGKNFVGDLFGSSFDGPTIATGGTTSSITDGGVNYILHTFTGSGTFSVVRGGKIDFVVIAGGGPGGGGNGGGGAGGMSNTTNYSLTKTAANYAVTVGGFGSDSSIGSFVSSHRGGTGASPSGTPGGSGGGGTSRDDPCNCACAGGGGGSSNAFGPQGYNGGGGTCHNNCGYAPMGGGGGAGGGGSQGGGGGGRSSTITGSSQTYAAGGGGGGSCAPGNSPGGYTSSYGLGNSGGGVVYIRYRA